MVSRQSVVVTFADAADGRLDAGFGKSLRMLDLHVRAAAVVAVHEAATPNRSSVVQYLLERIEHEAGMRAPAGAPIDDRAGVGVDDEGDIDPIFAAIDTTVAQRDAWSFSCSSTIRTDRARTSDENVFVVLLVIAPSSRELGLPTNPARFTSFEIDVALCHHALTRRSDRRNAMSSGPASVAPPSRANSFPPDFVQWLSVGGDLNGMGRTFVLDGPIYLIDKSNILGECTFLVGQDFIAQEGQGIVNIGANSDLGKLIIDGGEILSDALFFLSGVRPTTDIGVFSFHGSVKGVPFTGIDIPANQVSLTGTVSVGSRMITSLTNQGPLRAGCYIIAPGVFPRDTKVVSIDSSNIHNVTVSNPALVNGTRQLNYQIWRHGQVDLRGCHVTNCGWRGCSIEGTELVYFPDRITRVGGAAYADTACGSVFYGHSEVDRADAPYRVFDRYDKSAGSGNPRANTSLTPNSVGLGAKTFVVESGHRNYRSEVGTTLHVVPFVDGIRDNSIRMVGRIVGYNPTTLSLDLMIETAVGQESFSTWSITGEFEGFYLWDPATQYRAGDSMLGRNGRSSPGDGFMLSEDGVGDWGRTVVSTMVSDNAGWAGFDIPSNIAFSTLIVKDAGTSPVYVGFDLGGDLANVSGGTIVVLQGDGPAAIRFAGSVNGAPTTFKNIRISNVVVVDKRNPPQLLQLVSANNGPSSYDEVTIDGVTVDGVPNIIVVDGAISEIPNGITVQGSQTDSSTVFFLDASGFSLDPSFAPKAVFKQIEGTRLVWFSIVARVGSVIPDAEQTLLLPKPVAEPGAMIFINRSQGLPGYVDAAFDYSEPRRIRLRATGGGFTPLTAGGGGGDYFTVSGTYERTV